MPPSMLPQPLRFLSHANHPLAVAIAGVLLGLLMLLSANAQAETVSIKISDKVAATADYRPGGKDRPAILLMHGFLQTRDFAIIKSLADELASAGYTVLSPTLSLSIPNRNKSLDCEAVHLHNMDDDVGEIQQWVQWLRAKGHKRIVGIGHSFGGTHLLAWAEKHPHDDFSLIAVSLTGNHPLSPVNNGQWEPLRPGTGLLHAPLSFCSLYTSPARDYLSYLHWDEKKIISTFKSSKIQTNVILGSGDNRLTNGWSKQLREAGIPVHIVKDANHFMDGTNEFDLFEVILELMKK